MHLWNDYEGAILAGAFPLEKLLATEGRSAFFATRDRSGQPAVIRLTEALNDEQQLRARYRAIQLLSPPHLVTIEGFGETEYDGAPLIYLVMEPTQESLAEILHERRLTVEETNDVATAIVGAVEALHANGLVHGQIAPASVLAAGEVIKLRSDCVRPAPSGTEGARIRAEDVFGVANVLNQCLTQNTLEDASDALALPEPYASIVRHSLRGTWEIEQVAAELRRFVRGPVAPPAGAAASHAGPQPGNAPTPATTENPTFAESLVAATRVLDKAAAAADGDDAGPSAIEDRAAAGPPEEQWQAPARRGPRFWLLGAAVLLLLLFVLWHLSGSSRRRTTAAVAPPAALQARPPAPAPSAPPTAGQVAQQATQKPAPPAPAPPAAPATVAQAAPTGGQVWRVVAYTYHGQGQAEAKARMIAARYADLRPEVFTPSGHAPYLVTLGGPLSRSQAAELRVQARKEGVARDVYMQNYSH